MSDFTRTVGRNIRNFRRASRLTLEEMAERIHKSKATVGKYEQGSIAIDADTLYEIASVLHVSPSLLLTDQSAPKGKGEPPAGRALGCLYLYDGRTKRIVKSLLVGAEGSEDVALFYDAPAFDEAQKCRALYCGHRQAHESVTNYLLENRQNEVEHIFLCMMRSLDRPDCSTGLISGISSRMYLPASAKCILSPDPLPENDELKDSLLLTKEDMKLTKRYNMFMVEQGGLW